MKISFTSKQRPLVFATDRFDRWQDNVRAIALGLEALRKVDRYGISDTGQQYAGWAALPESSETAESAASIIADIAQLPLEAVLNRPKHGYRQALIRAHPDRGGTVAALERVQNAGQHLGVT